MTGLFSFLRNIMMKGQRGLPDGVSEGRKPESLEESMKTSKVWKQVQRFLNLENFKWKKEFLWVYAFMLPCMVVFVVFYLVPIVTVVTSSFTEWDGFNEKTFIGFDNYIRLFQASNFQAGFRNFLAWALLAATVHTGFGVLVAFVLHKKLFGWKFARTVFMIPNVVSAAAWALIFRFGFDDKMGIVNNLIRVFSPGFEANWIIQEPYAFWLITFTWLFFAVIVTLVVLGDLLAVPDELREAAKIDGANGLQISLKIDLPLCRISIGTSVILAMTARLGMYEIIQLTTAGGPGQSTYSLPMLMVGKIQDYQAGYANSVATVMIVIGIIILLVVNRLFRMNDSIY